MYIQCGLRSRSRKALKPHRWKFAYWNQLLIRLKITIEGWTNYGAFSFNDYMYSSLRIINPRIVFGWCKIVGFISNYAKRLTFRHTIFNFLNNYVHYGVGFNPYMSRLSFTHTALTDIWEFILTFFFYRFFRLIVEQTDRDKTVEPTKKWLT